MEKSDRTNSRNMILGSGILVAFYVTLQFTIYFYKPHTTLNSQIETEQFQLPKEATFLNAAMAYMISIVGIQKK